MTINLFYLLLIFICINIRAFQRMAIDKKRAKRNDSQTGKGRTSEGELLARSIFFGFIGIGLGMLLLWHKVRKNYFVFGVPYTALMNTALFFLLKEELEEDRGMEFIFDYSIITQAVEYLQGIFQ